jgi:sugar fermentation stimulation protein A
MARRKVASTLLLGDEDSAQRGLCYVEVKNVTLDMGDGLAMFPRCCHQSRGAKHLRELMAMVAAGHRAVSIFLCSAHPASTVVEVAAEIDPAYAQHYGTRPCDRRG